MKLNKREVIDLLEREYINGTATLNELAGRLGVTAPSLAYYGRMAFPNWREVSQARNRLTNPLWSRKNDLLAQSSG